MGFITNHQIKDPEIVPFLGEQTVLLACKNALLSVGNDLNGLICGEYHCHTVLVVLLCVAEPINDFTDACRSGQSQIYCGVGFVFVLRCLLRHARIAAHADGIDWIDCLSTPLPEHLP